LRQASRALAVWLPSTASATGTLACVDAWIEDFRKDVSRNDVPTRILHGDADRILPPDATSRRQAKMIKDVKLVELKDGPHGVLWTHAEQVNTQLVSFLANPTRRLMENQSWRP